MLITVQGEVSEQREILHRVYSFYRDLMGAVGEDKASKPQPLGSGEVYLSD